MRLFASREARRGNTYQGIIMDPPKFGRGANGQVWDFFKKMPSLVQPAVKSWLLTPIL